MRYILIITALILFACKGKNYSYGKGPRLNLDSVYTIEDGHKLYCKIHQRVIWRRADQEFAIHSELWTLKDTNIFVSDPQNFQLEVWNAELEGDQYRVEEVKEREYDKVYTIAKMILNVQQ